MVFLVAEVGPLGLVLTQEFHTEYPDVFYSEYTICIIPATTEQQALKYLETLTSTLTGRRFSNDQIRLY